MKLAWARARYADEVNQHYVCCDAFVRATNQAADECEVFAVDIHNICTEHCSCIACGHHWPSMRSFLMVESGLRVVIDFIDIDEGVYDERNKPEFHFRDRLHQTTCV